MYIPILVGRCAVVAYIFIYSQADNEKVITQISPEILISIVRVLIFCLSYNLFENKLGICSYNPFDGKFVVGFFYQIFFSGIVFQF